MPRFARAVLLVAVVVSPLQSQPFIFYRGIVNSASYAPQGLPNGSIARGSVFTIFGRNFGPTQAAQVSAFPLQTTFQNLGVSVCQNGTCIPAIPVFVSAGQVNAIMPSNAPLGPVSLRVVFNGAGGYYASATVVASSFGIFSVSGGFGPGIVQNFTPEATPINSLTASARPGQTVILWGTGLGAGLNADNVAPQAGDLPVDVEIWVGGKKVTINRYSGRSPCCSGVDQIVFDLPADTPAGCYVPIQVRSGQIVSNSVSIAVSANGGACSDPFNPLSQMFRTGGKLGLAFANRVNALLNLFETDQEETVEFAIASLRRENGGQFAYNALASLPPPGSCTVHAVPGEFMEGTVMPAFRASGGELNAGNTLNMGSIVAGRSTYYSATLAGTMAGFRTRGLPVSVLNSGLQIRGSGGADLGPFALDVPAAPAIRWTDRASAQAINRNGGFRINWEGGDAPGDVALIAGINANVPANATAVFVCTAAPGTKSFAVPPYITQALPASIDRSIEEFRFGYAMVGALPLGAAIAPAPAGLDAAAAVVASWSARAVAYQ